MDQLLIALDVDTASRAASLADALRGAVGGFKIGSHLFTAEGPPSVARLVERGDRVFLDLKFHDIPNTVAGAVRAATRLGVWMTNVHASGGLDMMRAAKAAAVDASAQASRATPLVLGVTVLTSLDHSALPRVGIARPLDDHVVALAMLAREAGLDGVVASPWEIARIRAACGRDFLIVTPGIRSGPAQPIGRVAEGAGPRDDQARTLSARAAIRAGASYIVVGRPVVEAADPRAAAEQIAEELRQTP